MNIMSMSCASCGAPIQIPPDVDQFNCSHCGTALIVQRGEGYVALKVAEHLTKAIQDSSRQTSSAISEGTQVTQVELKRLQLIQELSTATTQLGNIQAQIRFLKSQKSSREIDKQLRELRAIEASTLQNINSLQLVLTPKPAAQDLSSNLTQVEKLSAPQVEKPRAPKVPFTSSPFKMGCLTFWVVSFIGTAFIMAIPGLQQNEALYNIIGQVIILISIAVGVYVGYRVSKKRNASKPAPSQVLTKESEGITPQLKETQNSRDSNG